jgi:hypothetical protein
MKAATVVMAMFVCGAFLLARPKSSAGAAEGVTSNGTVSSHAAVSSRSSGADAGAMKQQIVAKEREGLEALKSGKLELFGELTAEDAVFVDAAGPATKAQVMSNVAGFQLTEYAMDDVRFVAISEKAGLISYAITEKGVSHGHEFAAHVYVSSVWAERGGKWVCLFSQETAARPPRVGN